MNWYMIFGLILVGIGTGMILYGEHHRDSFFQKKVQETLAKIESEKALLPIEVGHKADALSPAQRMDAIGTESREWAAEFLSKKENKKLEYERSQLEAKTLEIQLSDQTRTINRRTSNILSTFQPCQRTFTHLRARFLKPGHWPESFSNRLPLG